MKKQRLDGLETRKKLLEAASEIFAQKGFWETTNADICRKADVNTASVNYHFGSKENLYIQAWKFAFDQSIAKHPPDGGIDPQACIEKRFRGRIQSIIQRIIDPQAYDFDIIHKEMANPTGLLTETIENAISPLEDQFKATLKELLGKNISKENLSLCHMSIMSQCFGPMLRLRHIRKGTSMPGPKDVLKHIGIEEIAKHIVRFSLAGIKAYVQET